MPGYIPDVRITIGCDHAGYALKLHLLATLDRLGHSVTDLGTDSEEPVDYPPICAAVGRAVHDEAARLARAHNDANVLSLGGRVIGAGLADEILVLFLTTPFEGGRHARRVAQLMALEEDR